MCLAAIDDPAADDEGDCGRLLEKHTNAMKMMLHASKCGTSFTPQPGKN